MPKLLRCVVVLLILTLLIGVPVAHSVQVQSRYRNLHVVHPGVLVRSGQLSEDALRSIVHDLGIKTVITLRDAETPGNPPPDEAEAQYCRELEVHHIRLGYQAWISKNETSPAPVEPSVRKFVEIMNDPGNYPVLVHCWAGVHRTGAYCAIYRMEFDHWTNTEAIAELKSMGYDTLDDEWDILGYLEDYWPSWKGPPPDPGPKRRPGVKPGVQGRKPGKKRESN
jgi:tyrosine-protein phosphatase SIW14